MASGPERRPGEGALGGSGQAAYSGRAGKLGSVASLLALGRVGFRPRRSGPETPEPGPSGPDGETFCPSSAAFQGPGSGQARSCPRTRCHRPGAGRWVPAIFLSAWPLRPWFPLACGPRPTDPAAPASRACPEGRLLPRRPPLAGRAGAGPLGPGAAAPARLAARSFWRP